MTPDTHQKERKPDPEEQATFLHWTGGAAILGLDWLLFSANMLSGGLGTLAIAATGFIAGSITTAGIQRFAAGDPLLKSLAKGALGGVIVGIPMPLAGTAVGGLVLGLSGLNRFRRPPGRTH